jgi:hypothetical protein
MSSVSQQHLTSADMNMIMRVHAGVCTRDAIAAGSLDAKGLTALLVRGEGQHGVRQEARVPGASTADDALKLSIPVSRTGRFIGNALGEWEAESETAPHRPFPRLCKEATA